MNPRNPTDDVLKENSELDDSPQLEQQDWDAVVNGDLSPDSMPENGDFRYDEEGEDEVVDEDDDNPFQGSDEALPDDEEELEISRHPAHERSRFGG